MDEVALNEIVCDVRISVFGQGVESATGRWLLAGEVGLKALAFGLCNSSLFGFFCNGVD